MHDLIAPIPASPQLEQLLDERDTILAGVDAQLAEELAAVRADEPRADTKAGHLQQLCSGLLLAGLAMLSSGTLTGPAAALGWSAAGLLGAAVTLLSAASRPNLGTGPLARTRRAIARRFATRRTRPAGGFGFVRWARLAGDAEVIAALARDSDPDTARVHQARKLRWLSRALYGRFARIRAAHTLLVTALALAALAAALTANGR